MTNENAMQNAWIRTTRQEIHETAIVVMEEVVARGGLLLSAVPRPIDEIANVLGSHVERASERWLHGNKGLCTESVIVVKEEDGRDWVRRFTVAHELGHQWLGNSAEEWECNAFAGSILIPQEDITHELQRRHLMQPETLERWAHYEHSGGLITQLVRRYGVGYHALIRALADYGWVVGVAVWTSHAYGMSLYEEYEHFYRGSMPH